MVRKTKEEAEKTRELLLDAAEHVFLEKGVTSTSLDDISKFAGVTRGALYWHFKNKNDLFEAMHARVKLPMDELLEKVSQDKNPIKSLKELCVHVLCKMAEDERTKRVFTIILMKCEDMDQARTRCEEVAGKFTKIFAESKLQDGLTPELASLSLHSYMNGLFNNYLRNSDKLDMPSLAPNLIDIIFKGLVK